MKQHTTWKHGNQFKKCNLVVKKTEIWLHCIHICIHMQKLRYKLAFKKFIRKQQISGACTVKDNP
jgi:hypothetical protein